MLDFFAFFFFLFLVIKSAGLATHYAAVLAKSFRISKYIVGFIIVAIISILPETFISVSAALQGIPEFGLGTLFGSNVADLTLVFVLSVFLAGRGIKIESKVLKNRFIYTIVMFVPLLLGLNGYYSRWEGAVLVMVGVGLHGWLVYVDSLKKNYKKPAKDVQPISFKNVFLLLVSLGILLLGSHFTVHYAVNLAHEFALNPILIGMFVVGVGTTLPELLFSIKSLKKHYDGLAVGDVLGTVVTDATIVVGILAIVSPFSFEPRLIYITGFCMFLATVLLFRFMNTGRLLSKKEAVVLICFYILFIFAEYVVSG